MASNQDAVIIKTIHKSKGLEFPFVFLCKTSKQFNKKEINAKSMMLSYEKGIGFKFNNNEKFFTYTTLAFDAIKNENNIDMLSEEMRLLYVALTRAKEKIFITLNINLKQNKSGKNEVNILSEKIANSGKITPEIVMSVKNMQEWILLALLGYQKDLFLYENKIVDNSTKCNWKTDAKIKFIKANDIKLKEIEKEEKEIDEVQVDENIVKELEKYINFKYDNKLVKMQSKLSVSEVAKKDDSENYFYQIPKLDENIGELSAAEKGTATHSFMELSDYDKASINVLDEINRLVSIGLLSKKQGEAINVSSLEAFFNGEFYSRMKNSNNIMREKKFLVMISDLKLDDDELLMYNDTEGMLQGIADCIFEEDDGYVLVDYKTDNVNSVDELTQHYTLQLKLYKYAFELLLDKPVKSSYIYSFKLKQGVEIDL